MALSLFSSAFAHSGESFDTIADTCPLVIKTPSLEGRKTAKIRLPNGLTAFLVSDPGADQSAAALAVEAGSWHDPETYPGMAHLLEHMLFMGTAAYPGESEHQKFIFDNGGKLNAYTAPDRTVYMFSINTPAFSGALDRFAHFFIDPLFAPGSIARELHAVDQEHAKNIENDGWRQWMILKETGNPLHPNVKFSTGNAETLGGIPQEAMKEWFQTHYSADKMHLIIFSSAPMEKLLSVVNECFKAVPKREGIHFPIPDQLTSSSQRGHITYIKPVKELKTLTLAWELPKHLATEKDVQVGELLAYAFRSGAKNTLLGFLKKEHLAHSVRAFQEQLSKEQALFQIDIQLTEKGLEKVDDVITYTFEALSRLKSTGIPRYIFEELRQIKMAKYEFQSRTNAFEFVKEYAHNLVEEEIATFPAKSHLPQSYDPKIIQSYLELLTPAECLYFVVANPKKEMVQFDKKETWMGAEYTTQPISEKQLTKWAKAQTSRHIDLPPKNRFVPNNVDLISSLPSSDKEIPALIHNDDRAKVYYATDNRYLVPEITFQFRYKAPSIDGSARSKALCDLHLLALGDLLFPVRSGAEAAGFQIDMEQDSLGLQFGISGFSDGAAPLCEEIFSSLSKVHPSKEEFSLYFEKIKSSYENADKELPIFQSFSLMNSILTNDAPTCSQKLTALKTISYEELLSFSKQLMKQGYFEGLLYGNITKDEAQTLWSSLQSKVSTQGYAPAFQHKRKILTLPEKEGPYMVLQNTPSLGHSAVLLIEEGSHTFEKRAAQGVLGHLLHEEFYDALRTKQQVGYIAMAVNKEVERQLLQYFAVQSSSHKPKELAYRFEQFLEDFLKQFREKVSEERFETIRSRMLETLAMPPEALSSMGRKLFLLGFDYEGDFEWIDKRIQALEALTYESTWDAAREFLSRSNKKRLAILLEGVSQGGREFQYEEVSSEELRNSSTFVAWK